MLKKLRIVAFVPMVLMMFVIWGFSSNTGDTSSQQSMGIVTRIIQFAECVTDTELTVDERVEWEERIHTPIRKVAHMTEYMIFSWTVALPFLLYKKKRNWISIVTLAYCICYAAIDEIHQLFIPDRAGRVVDVLIDSIGILIGIAIFRKIYGATHSSEI